MGNGPKPLGITVLSVLSILAGILFLVVTFVCLWIASVATDPQVIQSLLNAGVPQSLIDVLPTLMAVLAVVCIVYTVVYFLIAYSFWLGLRWGWGLGMAFAVVEIVLTAVQFAIAPSVGGIFSAFIGVLIPLVILAYLNSPGPRRYFLGPAAPPAPQWQYPQGPY